MHTVWQVPAPGCHCMREENADSHDQCIWTSLVAREGSIISKVDDDNRNQHCNITAIIYVHSNVLSLLCLYSFTFRQLLSKVHNDCGVIIRDTMDAVRCGCFVCHATKFDRLFKSIDISIRKIKGQKAAWPAVLVNGSSYIVLL